MRKSQISVVGLALAAGYVLAGFVNRPTAGQSPRSSAAGAACGRGVAVPYDRRQHRGRLPTPDPDRHHHRALLDPREQPPGR